jgi:flagellar hook protein FlgE
MMTSLYTGISGLNANGTAMSVIGDNIANLNTNGFKNSRVTFGDVLSQTVSGGTGQIGRGVMVKEISTEHIQGAFETTGNALDLAIDGDGFFQVNNGEMKLYTRAGQFSVNKDGKVVNPDGYILQAFLADPSGAMTGTSGDLVFSNAPSQAQPTANARPAINLNADEDIITDAFTLDANADGDDNDPGNFNSSTTIKVYDSLGGEHEITLYFTKTADNTWDVNFVNRNPDPTATSTLILAGTQTLEFDTDGSLIDDGSSAGGIDFDFGTGVVTPQTITFDFGTGTGGTEDPIGTGLDGTTQFSSGFSVSSFSQDGYGAGVFQSISFNEGGIISAVFTNGQSKTIGQMALARFLDPGGLNKLGRNMFSETFDSGQPVIGAPETSGLGRLLSNTLELSNVDLSTEFVKLISAQRAFQANSRVITTTDEMMQDLVNLKR